MEEGLAFLVRTYLRVHRVLRAVRVWIRFPYHMRLMKTRLLAGAVIAGAIACLALAYSGLPAVIGRVARPAVANPADCASLTTLKLPDVKVTEAAAVPAATTGAVSVPHCRVAGVIGKEIRFTLLLPDEWNRKFMMGGGGGFVGRIDNQARAS